MDEQMKQEILLQAWKDSGERARAQADYNREESRKAAEEGREPRLSNVSREELARRSALDLSTFLMGDSLAGSAVESVWAAYQPKVGDERKDAGVFQAVIVGANLEQSTKRMVVDFQPMQGGQPSGVLEYIRTHPTYTEAGAYQARAAQSLLGHRVLIYKDGERFKGKSGFEQSAKVLVHLVDLGPYRGEVPPGVYQGQSPHPIHGSR